MAISATAGSTLAIGTTETINSPDDLLMIGEIVDLGALGRTYKKIEAPSIGTRGIRKYKGTYDDGTMTIKLNRDPADTGQAAAIVARDNDGDYNFRLTLNDYQQTSGFVISTIIDFKAKVMSYTLEPGGVDNMVGSTLVLEVKSGSITETAAH
jgi:hypothetical protein